MSDAAVNKSSTFVDDNFAKMQEYFDYFFDKSKDDPKFSDFLISEDSLKGWLMASFVTGLDFALNHHPDLVQKP